MEEYSAPIDWVTSFRPMKMATQKPTVEPRLALSNNIQKMSAPMPMKTPMNTAI